MTARRETVLTLGLILACLALTGINLWPRLTVGHAPVVQGRPDIRVTVSGAVLKPGSYTLSWGSRLEDAVAAAGGFHPMADRNLVNPSAPLEANSAVFVPSVQAETGGERISVNNASAADLDTLPGIGPAMAQRIIEGRPYGSVEELLRVRGIGDKTLEKLRPFITL